MDFNTFLTRLGIDPDSFKNIETDPIKTENGYIFYAEQRSDERVCPYCHSKHTEIKGYHHIHINCSDNKNIQDILRVKKVRLMCLDCHKTFTPPLKGIARKAHISDLTKQLISNDFTRKMTFQGIANKYSVSNGYVVALFDAKVRFVPRSPMPKVLCIDEFHFSAEFDQKYCCCLVDFQDRSVLDIIKSRQMPYLREYFSNISQSERSNVIVFISDMYDGYSTIKQSYFPNAIHVIDLFHVITQMTNVINLLRTRTMNTLATKGSKEYNFMKSNWKYFLCRRGKIPSKTYTYQKTGEVCAYSDLLFSCLILNNDLLNAYNILQDLFKYSKSFTFTEAENFVIWIFSRLLNSQCEDLKAVGRTYRKWRVEIANAFVKNQTGENFTNALAENMNNHIKTIIKSTYGYQNFERFRKRCLLMLRYNKCQ